MWIYNLNNGLYFSHTDSGLDLVFLKKIKSVRCYCSSQVRFTKSENLVKSKSLIFIMYEYNLIFERVRIIFVPWL